MANIDKGSRGTTTSRTNDIRTTTPDKVNDITTSYNNDETRNPHTSRGPEDEIPFRWSRYDYDWSWTSNATILTPRLQAIEYDYDWSSTSNVAILVPLLLMVEVVNSKPLTTGAGPPPQSSRRGHRATPPQAVYEAATFKSNKQ
uniref:Uncharacterized protein n=1 Tax=Oryza sativa subsp. japonica TaxID=39947 RepID=Q6YS29_ORYSJ|nr:hypothetical protein [Oryza sativa Japonica Group]